MLPTMDFYYILWYKIDVFVLSKSSPATSFFVLTLDPKQNIRRLEIYKIK